MGYRQFRTERGPRVRAIHAESTADRMGRGSCRGLLAAGGLALAVAAASAQTPDLRLIDAVKRQQPQAVAALLAAAGGPDGIDVNAAQLDGATALHWAAYYDDLETARRLPTPVPKRRPRTISA